MINIDIISKILAPVLTAAILAVIKHYLEGKSKLNTYFNHSSAFNLNDANKTIIHTHNIVLINSGKKTAKNVRVSHAFLPLNFSIHPYVDHEIKRNDQTGAGDIIFPTMVPKEQISISYLYFPPITWQQVHSNIKSDDGFATTIQIIPSPQPKKITILVASFLIFVGASFLLYLLINFLLQNM